MVSEVIAAHGVENELRGLGTSQVQYRSQAKAQYEMDARGLQQGRLMVLSVSFLIPRQRDSGSPDPISVPLPGKACF